MSRQPHVEIVPVTLPVANDYVARLHRHHAPIPGGFGWFCIGAVADGQLRGVAIAGRPTNRNNDDRQTIEVLRVASDGTPNVCSALLGACGRAGRAVGASRVITYTLDGESGSSLRAVGWEREAEGIQSWWTHEGGRTPAVRRDHHDVRKVRWALNIRPPVEYVIHESERTDGQTSLFAESSPVGVDASLRGTGSVVCADPDGSVAPVDAVPPVSRATDPQPQDSQPQPESEGT